MTTADAIDRVVYRILAFKVAAFTDPDLTQHVFGNRLRNAGSPYIRIPTSAWLEYKNYQLASLSTNAWGYTCISDLSGFYLAIDTELLCNRLRLRSVPEQLVQPLERLFNKWHAGRDLRGLPVGGESSGVLSNSFLLPIDDVLAKYAGDYGMYGDDFAIFAAEAGYGRAILEILDDTFSTHLGLRRSVSKTREFTDPEEAAEYIENHLLVSIDVLDELGDDETTKPRVSCISLNNPDSRTSSI
jgi:Reverse transcriptase (RNA-dependent DNA polymerase)